jgi:phosphate transport system substrate-binding protein
MKRNLFKSVLAIVSLLTIVSCSSNNGGNEEEFQAVELLSCGSTSVEKVISKLGEKFASLTDNKVTFKKDQHGSGDATKGVTEGINNLKYDIGFLSREIKDSEKANLSDGNLSGVMCKDAVVPIVNENNSYSATNADTLAKLYKGEVKSWNDVDSTLENKNVKLYSREAGSGTRECFFEGIGYSDVKAEDKWNDGVIVSSQASNGDMMSAIKDDKYGIGYCSLDSLTSASGIKGLTYEGVTASEDTVIDGTYKLSRNFNYVIRCDYSETESNKKLAVNAFIDFMSTKEGLSTIKSVGGIVSGLTSAPSWSSIQKEKYPEL